MVNIKFCIQQNIFQNKGDIKMFPNKQKQKQNQRNYVTSIPTLKKTIAGVLQTERHEAITQFHMKK